MADSRRDGSSPVGETPCCPEGDCPTTAERSVPQREGTVPPDVRPPTAGPSTGGRGCSDTRSMKPTETEKEPSRSHGRGASAQTGTGQQSPQMVGPDRSPGSRPCQETPESKGAIGAHPSPSKVVRVSPGGAQESSPGSEAEAGAEAGVGAVAGCRRLSGPAEESAERHVHHRHLPFRKKVVLVPPEEEAGPVDRPPPAGAQGGRSQSSEPRPAHQTFGDAVSSLLKKVPLPFVRHERASGSRWRPWRRSSAPDEAEPSGRSRARRSSVPASEGAFEPAVLPLLRRRRRSSSPGGGRSKSAGRRRSGSPRARLPLAVQVAQQCEQALQRRLRRRSCPELPAAEPRHVVVRRALLHEEELLRLGCESGHLEPPMEAFTWNTIDQEDESQIYVKFFKFHKCYDLIPTSAKLVVFDTQLLVKKAFFALVYNGVRAAPLWDSKKQQYVGMLTITDFIRILQMYYRNSDERIEELEEHKLETWRTVLESDSKPLIYIAPEASLYEAITTLLENRIHRLPVIDPVSGDVLYIITHKRILRFLCLYIHNLPRPSFVSRTLAELRIGTFDRIETARPDTPVIEALTKFVNRRVSALPIVDQDDKLTHIYAKFDVINLAAEKTYNNLNVPLMAANSHRSDTKVEACRMTDTLSQVLEKIVHAEVHRLVITDDDQHVIGIISLSDILDALVIRPHEYNSRLSESPDGEDLDTGDGDLLGADERHTIVEEEPGDEEEPVGVARLTLSHKDA